MSILTYFTREDSSSQGIVLPCREKYGVLETESVLTLETDKSSGRTSRLSVKMRRTKL